ncbi:hypothetical protein CcCBS67573_g09171 [Chytriomyces confervae]|uniref:RING-type E3 ubiquitin transferase n=1 Tax=Chytriomyces confervae TaxID=246404 RepID=A0A507E5M0_9FUNG|nr:hypothetical protein CcCBS67573_g09171 [Chytriomyces confervae]
MSSRVAVLALTAFLLMNAFDGSDRGGLKESSFEKRSKLENTYARISAVQFEEPSTTSLDLSFQEKGPFYSNASGLYKAQYIPSSTATIPDASKLSSRGQFDWASPGSFSLLVRNYASPSINWTHDSIHVLEGVLRIKVTAGTYRGRSAEYKSPLTNRRILRPLRSRVLSMPVNGFYLLDHGKMVLSGFVSFNSSTHENIERALSIIGSSFMFGKAKDLALQLVQADIHRLTDEIDDDRRVEYKTSSRSSDVKCLFNIQIQMESISDFNNAEIRQFEQDLIENGGVSSFSQMPPQPQFSASVFSPNCQFILRPTQESQKSIKIERYRQKAINYAGWCLLGAVVEVTAMLRQMAYTDTPSKRAKVSLSMLSVMISADAYLCLVHFVMAQSFGGDVFLSLVGVSFGKFLGFSVLGMRYLLDVSRSRGPDGRASVGMFYSRTCGFLISGVYFFYKFGPSSPFIMNSALVVASSLWVPQILSNVKRNSRNSLHPSFLLMTSVSRLMLGLYYLACPSNILTMTIALDNPRYWTAAAVTAWVGVQILVIYLQDRWGTRALIPEKLYPKRYDYHRATRFEKGSKPQGSECAICFSEIFTNNTLGNDRNRDVARYMLTPCDHVFHTDCLERWMDIKLECPVCRESLPPQ